MLSHNLVALKDCLKCWRDLARLHEGQEIDFAYRHVIKPMQVRSEIEGLLDIVRERRPRVVLEIGTATGGTLFLFCRHVAENALIVSIDLRRGRFGNGYPAAKAPLYKCFARKDQKIALIRGNSHLEETRFRAKKILLNKTIEFLFIDGDHTYDGVKADFDVYSKLVAPGGFVAFHDIVEHPAETGCEVSRFWNEIKSCYRHAEIINDRKQGWAGIGVLYL
jgi:predicted O-methyltransferase YrrM